MVESMLGHIAAMLHAARPSQTGGSYGIVERQLGYTQLLYIVSCHDADGSCMSSFGKCSINHIIQLTIIHY